MGSRPGQIAQPVTDLPRATAFYEKIVGIDLLFEAPRMAFFKDTEGNQLALMSEVPAEPNPGPAAPAGGTGLT